jgi:hypothetical protein
MYTFLQMFFQQKIGVLGMWLNVYAAYVGGGLMCAFFVGRRCDRREQGRHMDGKDDEGRRSPHARYEAGLVAR